MKFKYYFDLDGTVADLYNSPNWLAKLESEQPIFESLPLMVEQSRLNQICELLHKKHCEIGVITWLPRFASHNYEVKCRAEKQKWVKKFMPLVTEFHAISYGTPKQEVVFMEENTIAVLIDDNKEVREMWKSQGQEFLADDPIDFFKNMLTR